jgi:hypothetical protein
MWKMGEMGEMGEMVERVARALCRYTWLGQIQAIDDYVDCNWRDHAGGAYVALDASGLWACTGCGSMKSIDQIRKEHPEAIACCPERKMAPMSEPSK